MIKVFVSMEELYPIFILQAKDYGTCTAIEMSDVDIAAWKKCVDDFESWQEKIERLVFKAGGLKYD